MGIQIEFCPDLALRNIIEYKEGRRKKEECIPEDLEAGKIYEFLKKGQRIYWFNDDPLWSKGELPLAETKGDQNLSRPIASAKILEVTHFMEEGIIYTKGKYKIIEIFKDDKVHFENLRRI